MNHRYPTESVGAKVEVAVGVTEQSCDGKVLVMIACVTWGVAQRLAGIDNRETRTIFE
jgi:hypothetical protein